ncbi:hypothetical protein Rhe02_72860 [Rhizocola hellebori]|uniref:Membrane-associated oxidoreductase n=1 Tax=Rhizocola hellebori TaxID=1392758 RepID=A0A8J3VJA4_9ACTN|nr:hypothetical protein [Rhizocola hellebori]GIH09219.1 hypothetical protein Rhe02_72860 [Rhizocola hellebori]
MELTQAEKRLWANFATGEELRLGEDDPLGDDFDAATWGADRQIRAEVIASLMLGAAEGVAGQSSRVYLTGAHIVGPLVLNGATLTQELAIINSYFDTAPDFGNVQARSIWLDSCRMPGFGGWSMEITNTLALLNCRAESILLRSTRVGIDLEMSGLRVGGNSDLWALDCSGLVVNGGLRADRMVATGGVNLTAARVGPWLDLTGAQITVEAGAAALLSTGVVVEGMMNVSDIKTNGMVDLLGVNVTGALMLTGARICVPPPVGAEQHQALSLEQARIGQHLLAPQLHLDGQLNLLGTKVEGVLELRNATLHSPGAIACFADQLQAGRFDGDNMVVEGQVSLVGAQIGRSVTFDRARFEFPEGIALDAMQISVAHNFELTEVQAQGGISIYSGEIGGDLVITGRTPANHEIKAGPTADLTAMLPVAAVDGRQLRVAKSLLLSDVRIDGQITLESATIGDISANRVTMDGDWAIETLVLDDCTVQRDVRLNDCVVTGELSAAGLQVGSDFKLNGGSISLGLRLENSTVQGDTSIAGVSAAYLTLANLTANGAMVAVISSQVQENLTLEDVTGAGSVVLTGTTVGGSVLAGGMVAKRFTPTSQVTGLLSLNRATIAEVSFDPSLWPKKLELDGLRFEELRHEGGWQRILGRSSGAFRMQPYTYLANYFRGTGHDDRARQVMLSAQRAHRRTRPWLVRLPGLLMDAIAGYGYAPGRAVAVLIGAWALGYWHFREFKGAVANPALYSADLIIPTAPFGLEAAEGMPMDGVAIALICIGWALSIAVLPAVTRSLGRN